jgi:Family of unknown function (DUF5880)
MSQELASRTSSVAVSFPLLGGGDIAKLLKSEGPVVTAVILKADATIEQVQIDTTPQKQMVQTMLGGPFTFLGQYEDEGIILMCRRGENDQLPVNQHTLQPPFEESRVRGDILCLRVAAQEDDEEDEVDAIATKSNDEFFLNYSKDEYVRFAARTDVKAPKAAVGEDTTEDDQVEAIESEEDEEGMEGESDEDDDDNEDEASSFMEMLMGQVIQRFQEDNGGRMPDEMELQAIQSAISQKMGALA